MRCPFRGVLGFLYLAGFLALAYVAWQGWGYYELPLPDRPHHPEWHAEFKPGGRVGHGVGILGSLMVLLLFIYSLRKRQKFGLRFGPMRYWLSIHIWLGFMGPMFITLHTAMKFGGIITVSYASMMAVMFSGFVGRYIYSQIPHSARGDTLSLEEIDAQVATMGQSLAGQERAQREIQQLTQRHAGRLENAHGPTAWLRIISYDLTRWIRPWRLRRALHRAAPGLSRSDVRQLAGVVERRLLLMRRRAFLQAVNSVFDLWHVIHKPFAWVAVIIMMIHIVVVVAMGYRWVF